MCLLACLSVRVVFKLSINCDVVSFSLILMFHCVFMHLMLLNEFAYKDNTFLLLCTCLVVCPSVRQSGRSSLRPPVRSLVCSGCLARCFPPVCFVCLFVSSECPSTVCLFVRLSVRINDSSAYPYPQFLLKGGGEVGGRGEGQGVQHQQN